MAEYNCVVCERSLRRRRSHVLSEHFLEARRDFVENILRVIEPPREVPFDGTRAICHACWHTIYAAVNQAPAPPAPAAPPPAAPPAAAPPAAAPPAAVPPADLESLNVPGVSRAANTSRRCMFDNCTRTQLKPVPNSIKVHLLSYYHFYVPPLARICQEHLLHTSIADIPGRVQSRQSGINAEGVLDIINMYTLALERRTFFNEDDTDNRSQDALQSWTGLRRENFDSLLNEIPSLGEQSNTPRKDLAIYLCKLRTGEPNSRIASLFDVSRRTVDRKIRKVRRCMETDFVPSHLGWDHITRQEVIERNRVLPNNIFGDEHMSKAIVILDGTYLFIQKSSNFLFQRKSYSLHKYRNLIKPFLIVCADGHILDVTGPYHATTSDATIMNKILENHDGPTEDGPMHYFFERGDILILDRGFRDSLPLVESFGYEAHMPPSKMRHETQLTTDNANKSRLITMCRWVVEAINGRLKRDFKLFRNQVFNMLVPHIFNDFKIAAALINRFQEPYSDSVYVNDFIAIIQNNMSRPNLLADYVIERNMNRQRALFSRLVADSPEISDFPRLTLEDLILFAIGTYHVRLARSYVSEHIKATGLYEIEIHRQFLQINNEESNILIRCRIQSRHVQRKIYNTYILYDPEVEGRDAVKQYYCSCVHGRRTLGSCAHIVSVIYYLGWARHEDIFNHPAHRLDDVILDIENQ